MDEQDLLPRCLFSVPVCEPTFPSLYAVNRSNRRLCLQCCVSSRRRARHTYHVHHGSDFEAAVASKDGSYDDSTFNSSRGASGDSPPAGRVRQLKSQSPGQRSGSETQVCSPVGPNLPSQCCFHCSRHDRPTHSDGSPL